MKNTREGRARAFGKRSIPAAVLALGTLSAGCVSLSHYAAQPTYDSPDAAFAAFAAAAQDLDAKKLGRVLGPGGYALLDAGDPVQLENGMQLFAERYNERHAIMENEDGSATLVVGENEWPFPIPVIPEGESWIFDMEHGAVEVADRRVGRNELSAINVCKAVVDAQNDYRVMNPEGTGGYAAKFFSDPGTKNGLFWPTTEDDVAPSPLGELAAFAAAEGYERGNRVTRGAFHGYYYRILTGQGPSAPGGERDYRVDGELTGGFAVLAWPAEYGQSGIMSFMADRHGIVYERDLGPDTHEIAESMEAFNPDWTWSVYTRSFEN